MEKIADTVDRIGRKVTAGYQKMESGVVNSYRKIENGAVTGFEKVTDRCIETLFARKGESAAEARSRLSRK